ncbi:PepSY domain-containing protein [Microvirga roseola]|uniref:PepSY domain-containing protein n=1 Tax=Microvirga roseola TaxID=2883126 RepID=UPI001E2F592A|nr:PepSY domain-containing protein [Microvirga roseola]
MRKIILAIGLGVGATTAMPAAAQPADETVLTEADRAANVVIERRYVYDRATTVTPSQIVARLRDLGYRDIHDFDVEYDHYEVEALSPSGEEVELEIDPVTGAILDIEENFF